MKTRTCMMVLNFKERMSKMKMSFPILMKKIDDG
jgi:hypothetical protein